jgi:hypothetical protein
VFQRVLSDVVEFTIGDIQKTEKNPTFLTLWESRVCCISRAVEGSA